MAERIGEIGEVIQGNIESVQVPQNSLRLSREDTLNISGQILHSPVDPRKGGITIVELRAQGCESNDRKGVGNDKLDKQLRQTKPGYYQNMMDRRHPNL